jgi:Zn-dependent metalloprotease
VYNPRKEKTLEQSIETICTDFNPKLAMILLQTRPDLMERWARYDEKENTTYFHFKALPVISEVIHTFEEPDPFFVSVQNIIDGLRVSEDTVMSMLEQENIVIDENGQINAKQLVDIPLPGSTSTKKRRKRKSMTDKTSETSIGNSDKSIAPVDTTETAQEIDMAEITAETEMTETVETVEKTETAETTDQTDSTEKQKAPASEKPKAKRRKKNAYSFVTPDTPIAADPVTCRKFLVETKDIKMEEIALMSDADIHAYFAKHYVVLVQTEDKTLITTKDMLKTVSDNLFIL